MMARVGDGPAENAAKEAAQTISQLLARVLNQLAMASWLPAAGLVLLSTFVLNLASHTGTGHHVAAPDVAINQTLVSLGRTGFGALALLIVCVVVATMLTQAFAFEAIRVLEGYWGTNQRLDKIAAWKTARRRAEQANLAARYRELSVEAWRLVEPVATAERKQRGSAEPKFTQAMLERLRQRIDGTPASGETSAEERATVRAYEWESKTSANLVRQRQNLGNRLRDYPGNATSILPTRLGNVLRKHEDDTGARDIETFVERNHDALPVSLQITHDEQRDRLELYCSMVFVLMIVVVVALIRFNWLRWEYSVATCLVLGTGIWVTYRAAVASARHYGAVLVGVARVLRQQERERQAATAGA